MTPGQRGREQARAGLVLAGLVGFVLAPFLYIATPALMGFGSSGWETAPVVVAAVGILIGFIWMARIHREDPEPDHRGWRYRERG